MKTRTILAVMIIAVFVLPWAAFADTPQIRLYGAAILPGTTCPGVEQTYTLTIKNADNSTKELGSALVTVPAGFTVVGFLNVTSPTGENWAATWYDEAAGVIGLYATPGTQKLTPGRWVTVDIVASAPFVTGTHTWQTQGDQDTPFSIPANFTISGSQPSVEVVPCGCTSYDYESAWGKGADYPGANWSMFFTSDGASPVNVDLIAGQWYDAGEVSVTIDGSYLVVIITMQNGWEFNGESHAAIADDIGDLPHTPGGLIPGQFAYGGAYLTYTIPVPAYSPIYMAVHAKVKYCGTPTP